MLVRLVFALLISVHQFAQCDDVAISTKEAKAMAVDQSLGKEGLVLAKSRGRKLNRRFSIAGWTIAGANLNIVVRSRQEGRRPPGGEEEASEGRTEMRVLTGDSQRSS